MKKKVLKIIALIIAIALIVTVCWFANALCGNPISKWLAQKAADAYLDEHYKDTDFYIERLGFSFKSTDYYAHVRSETSIANLHSFVTFSHTTASSTFQRKKCPILKQQ